MRISEKGISGMYQGHIKFFLSVIHGDIRKMPTGYTNYSFTNLHVVVKTLLDKDRET